MNVFGVGPTELFVVLIVVLVLFGPDKLPELAKRIGGASRELRGSLNNITEQMDEALRLSMEQDKARMTPPAETTPSTVDSTAMAVESGKAANPVIAAPSATQTTSPLAQIAINAANKNELLAPPAANTSTPANGSPPASAIMEDEPAAAPISEANPPAPSPEV